MTMDAGDLAVEAFVQQMPTKDRWLLRAWRDAGYDALDALAGSGLLAGGRRHPEQIGDDSYAAAHAARLRQLAELPHARVDRQIAEHEAAHCWVALARGLAVDELSMGDGAANAFCRYLPGSDPIDEAAVSVAGEVWIGQFRSGRFPGGPIGCSSDRVDAAKAVSDWDICEARQRAHNALVTYGADVLAMADRLQRARTVQL